MGFHHIPVLLEECLEGLALKEGGAYLDCTLGGGGHSGAILQRIGRGSLTGIDRDGEAIESASEHIRALNCAGSFTALRGNFHEARLLLERAGIAPAFDGILIDLGVSSHQLDVRERGFSYHDDAPLDMRMDTSQPLSARDIVNTWSEDDLTRIFRDYGEEKWARQIARVLCDRRRLQPVERTGQLVEIVDAAIPKKLRQADGSHPARRAFQALRIAVNDELEPLADALRMLAELLLPGGRLCVITFHSLEDRIVKNTFRQLAEPCICPKSFPVCVCGRKATVKLVTRKPITASQRELEENPRARSASLRIIEKL